MWMDALTLHTLSRNKMVILTGVHFAFVSVAKIVLHMLGHGRSICSEQKYGQVKFTAVVLNLLHCSPYRNHSTFSCARQTLYRGSILLWA